MPAAKALAKGDKLTCEVCGLMLTVDETCGCIEADPIICCEMEMKRSRAAKPPAAKKPAAKKK